MKSEWTKLETELFERIYSLGAERSCFGYKEHMDRMERLENGDILVVRRYLGYKGLTVAPPDVYFMPK